MSSSQIAPSMSLPSWFNTDLFESRFFNLYWHYIFAGLVVYASARIAYSIIGCRVSTHKRTEDITFSTKLKNSGSEDDNEDDNAHPFFLPENLQHVPLVFERLSIAETTERAEEFYKLMDMRRSVRHFSSETVPIEVIRNIIRTAGTAPSGAHTQPWTYCVVASAEIKAEIRHIIEDEEETNYRQRMGREWISDLKPFKTNWVKEYLTEAPYLILIFKQTYGIRENGKRQPHYYNERSVALATGMLLTAIHYAGLVSLTSTPLNCGPRIRELLARPISEKLLLLLPVGYPHEDSSVPDLTRKSLDEILVEF